jgi:hypothetical protein
MAKDLDAKAAIYIIPCKGASWFERFICAHGIRREPRMATTYHA